MSIGQAGKQARQLSHRQQQRYRVAYTAPAAETAELQPPVRRAPRQTEPESAEHDLPMLSQGATSLVQTDPNPTEEEGMTGEPLARRQSGKRKPVSPQAVADQVYALLMHDLRIEGERLGKQARRF